MESNFAQINRLFVCNPNRPDFEVTLERTARFNRHLAFVSDAILGDRDTVFIELVLKPSLVIDGH